MLLSIVIATYNRSAFLRQTLLLLEQQSDMEFEVIVAIDGGTDDTPDMLAALDLPYNLTSVDTHCSDYGLAVARNMGILAARGEAVVILDDDSVPDPDFVAAHKRGVQAGVITGGPRWPENSDDSYMAWKAAELCKVTDLTPLPIQQHRARWPNAYLIENNICMLREDFIRLGLFSERLKLYGFIGQEFFERAAYCGFSFQVNHNASIKHHGHIEGDNGFFRSQKTRQTWWATLLRSALSRPSHYRAQIKWAALRSAGDDGAGFAWPPYWPTALTSVPITQVRLTLGTTKRFVRSIVRGRR